MDHQDANQVCAECSKKTQIHYKYVNNFFGPRLNSMKDLGAANTGLMRNIFAVIGEWLYLQYDRLKHLWLGLKKWLFPRKDKIWGQVEDSYLSGKLVYASRYTPRKPLRHIKLEFWARTQWWQWRKIAQGYTDEDGRFHLPFDLRAARNWKIKSNLYFEIHHTSHIYFDEHQKPQPVFMLYHTINFPKTDLTGMGYNLREIQLDLWQYRTDTTIPRAMITDPDGDGTEQYSEGRLDALWEQMIPIETIKMKHLMQIKDMPETISLAEIQADYPENLTICIEKKLPGYTRSDKWFGERMMNGMNCGSFMPDTHNPNHYWISYYGICNYDNNEEYALPDVDIKFELGADGLPLPLEIHTTGALNAINKDKWQKRVFHKDDGNLWLAAKRIARVNGAVSTEVDEHFTGTHLNTEQYSIAAHRNFHFSPISCLLRPHLKEVALINAAADKTIIGGYLPTATALTEKGLLQRTYDMLGLHDWKGWKPMKPLSEKHNYALAENLFWQVVNDFVEHFFAENLEQIKKHWIEVYYFSEDLVSHSVPVFLSDIDWNTLSPQEKLQAEKRKAYYSFMYHFDFNQPRERVNGQLKSVSPITQRKIYDEEHPEEMENLKKACKYAIMMATFMHTWINEHQYDDLGEILYNCGGLRFGTSETGVLGPESDLHIAPDLTRGTQMVWFTNLLSRTEYGFITRNEEGDVNPIFSQLLEAKREAFLKLGVNINHIESRTNI
ncbi:MAG: lipoxygenase family protein [Chitinophagales bacterium]